MPPIRLGSHLNKLIAYVVRHISLAEKNIITIIKKKKNHNLQAIKNEYAIIFPIV